MSLDDERRAFAARLNELLDGMGWPGKGAGRQVLLAQTLQLSQKGVRKWLEGEGFPTFERCVQLARMGDVSIEWLVTGRGPKHLTSQAPAPSRRDVAPGTYRARRAVTLKEAVLARLREPESTAGGAASEGARADPHWPWSGA